MIVKFPYHQVAGQRLLQIKLFKFLVTDHLIIGGHPKKIKVKIYFI